MAYVRSVWRKAAWLGCFLLVVGAVEFLLIVRLHNSLHIGEEEEQMLLAGRGVLTSHLAVERQAAAAVQRKQLHVYSWKQSPEEEEGGLDEREGGGLDGDYDEVRLARELRDLRLDRLNSFRQRGRTGMGSQLADQQRRNFELRQNTLLAVDKETQPQQRVTGDHSDLLKTSLQGQWLNVSRLLEEAATLRHKNAGKQSFGEKQSDRLKETLDKLDDIHAAQEGKEWHLKRDKDERENDKDYEEEENGEYDSEEDEEEYHRVFDPNDFVVSIGTDGKINITRKQLEPEVLLENMTLPMRDDTTSFEREGLNIMLTIRTTVSNHRKRLPLLFETWVTKVNSSQVFLVTDGDDPFTRLWASIKGIQYVDAKCGNSYSREQLCCKAGMELELMYREQNKAFDWICHLDDDMYVIMKNLVALLSGFNPRKDHIYLGRSGSPWQQPRRVKRKAKLSRPGTKYHFAVGGMYCLSRTMLDKTRKWLVGGKAFSESCSLTKEPEDVTVGFIVALQNYTLTRTERINTHGLHLASTVDPYTLTDQVAVSYGYGSVQWGEDPYNAVYVPDALFDLEEDESQFRSLHCLLYPRTSWCVHQIELVKLRRNQNHYEYSYDG